MSLRLWRASIVTTAPSKSIRARKRISQVHSENCSAFGARTMHVVPDQPLTATVEPVHRYTTVRPHPAIGMLTPHRARTRPRDRAWPRGHQGRQPAPTPDHRNQTNEPPQNPRLDSQAIGLLAQGQGHDLDEPGRPFHEHRRRRGPVLDL
ncbi:hypothetical protein HMPREF0682_1045 [Propionibacterium acidifaciens F0233]|uniref:Integrase core domain protein n=1 Tax=Propionibacterium acidifaciens F0233 TaxID=553198 RepID=U2QWW2_9ACTN|nr:hypothetical protein HMPREF0682_1045 [Propionibacterium acidifaciens F0233]